MHNLGRRHVRTGFGDVWSLLFGPVRWLASQRPPWFAYRKGFEKLIKRRGYVDQCMGIGCGGLFELIRRGSVA